jgi:hypothetical protein
MELFNTGRAREGASCRAASQTGYATRLGAADRRGRPRISAHFAYAPARDRP